MRLRRGVAAAIVALASLALAPASASAHGSERGFVLLLPTGYYLLGGGLAVAASFLLLSLAPPRLAERLAEARLRLGSVPALSPAFTSWLSFVLLVLLVAAGLWGSRDPLENPLPLAIWTVWWIGITLLHALLGNLWRFLNPWTGPYRLLDRLAGGAIGRTPPLRYPEWLGFWPAILLFSGFAWFELVHPAPDDPEILARAVALYWCVTFVGMVLSGEEAWTARAEPYAIFFRLVGGLAPVRIMSEPHSRRDVALAFPGATLLQRDPLLLSGVLFVLLTLSSVSFDGVSKTFWWLALGDINPLEFPGRTAVMGRNSVGLVLTFLALCAAYFGSVVFGWVLAGRTGPLRTALGTFVFAIVPISVAFHLSHYLTALLVQGQYALAAASDPFGTGADLLGLGHFHVTTSFLNNFAGVRAIWNVQTAAIVAGHVIAVALGHAMALRIYGDRRRAALSQIPLAVLTVLYTVFGLWLLSTPVTG